MYVEDRDACLCGEESEGTGEGVRTQFKFIKGLLIDIDSTDVITHQYTQVNGFVGKREGLPGNRVGPGERFESVVFEGRRVEDVEDIAFFPIYPEARNVGKVVYLGGEGFYSVQRVVGQYSIIGVGPDGSSGEGSGFGKKGVVGNYEEEGREGASLFDPAVYGDGGADATF